MSKKRNKIIGIDFDGTLATIVSPLKDWFGNNPRKIFCDEYIDDNNFGGIDYVLEKLRKRKEE